MARKSTMTNVILQYIARDDSAISLPEDELDAKYSEYLSSKDMSLLKIDPSKNPCIYTLRTFSTQKHKMYVAKALQEILPFMEEKPEDASYEVLAGAWNEYYVYARMALRDRIVGCSGHPMVQEVREDGSVDEVILRWEMGQPEPAGLVDSILSDDELVREMFQFLLTAAQLTERQKKA
jgi:hypothetical protein